MSNPLKYSLKWRWGLFKVWRKWRHNQWDDWVKGMVVGMFREPLQLKGHGSRHGGLCLSAKCSGLWSSLWLSWYRGRRIASTTTHFLVAHDNWTRTSVQQQQHQGLEMKTEAVVSLPPHSLSTIFLDLISLRILIWSQWERGIGVGMAKIEFLW